MPHRGRLGARLTTATVALAAMLFLAAPLPAWSPTTRLSIADYAAAICPKDLGRQIARHERVYHEGVLASSVAGRPAERGPSGGEGLVGAVRAEVERAIEAIRSHRPFREVVRQLGVVAGAVTDANDPLAAAVPAPPRPWAADYARYAERALPRFAVVFYGPVPLAGERTDLEGLVREALARGRELLPFLDEEYRQAGAAGNAAFDDRSTAFGIAAVCHSRAVSDAALAFRHVWLEAGGIDPRAYLPDEDTEMLLLPKGLGDDPLVDR